MRCWRENARHNTQCAHLRSKLVLATDASPRRPAIGRQFRNIDPVGPRWKRWGPKRNYPARPPKVGGHARGINRGDTRRNPQLTCRVSPEFCRTKRTIFTRTLRGMDRFLLFGQQTPRVEIEGTRLVHASGCFRDSVEGDGSEFTREFLELNRECKVFFSFLGKLRHNFGNRLARKWEIVTERIRVGHFGR